MMNYIKILFQGANTVRGNIASGMKNAFSGSVLLAACAVLIAFSSCAMGGVDPDSFTDEFDLAIMAPGHTESGINQSFNTKATVYGTAEECAIHTLTFLAYNSAGTSLELAKSITINPADNTSTDPLWNPVTSTISLVLGTGSKKIYVIANWHLNGDPANGLPQLSGIASSTNLENVVRTHNEMPSNPPIMTAYISRSLVAGEKNIPVQLTRQVARVDIRPIIPQYLLDLNTDIYIEGVRFINMADKSYMLPKTTSPAGTSTFDQTNYAGSSTKVTATSAATSESYGYYYIPEHFGSTATTSPDPHTTMLIKARYNGETGYCYYAVAINGHAGASPRQYAITRNHSYKYNITFIGPGAATEALALADETRSKAPLNCELVYE